MLDINNIFLFLFIFSILGVIRVILITIVSLLQTPPQRLDFSNRETILFGIFLSYIITFLIH